MAALHGSIDILDDDTGNFEEEHKFETFAQEFINQDDWHEVTTDRKVTFSQHQEPPPRNIMNITGIVSNYESIGTIPWSPSKKLSAKPKQPPSRPTPRNKSQFSLSQELVHQSQQTTPGNIFDNSIQTLTSPKADLSQSQAKSNNEEPVADSSKVAAAVALQAEVDQLKKEVAALVFMNNRYHLAISNCTFCVSADANTSDASTFLDASIRASSASCASSSSRQDPALLSSPIPALMSLTFKDMKDSEFATVGKSKDNTFISRMVKTLAKLEGKYLNFEHKRQKSIFTRKLKNGVMNSKELTYNLTSAYNYSVLAAPKPEKTVLDTFPHATWNDTRFKSAIPNPEPCPVLSCSSNHDLYSDGDSPSIQCNKSELHRIIRLFGIRE